MSHAVFVRDDKAREHFRACIRNIANDVAIDVDAEVNEYGPTFDYRDSLRSEKWVRDMSRRRWHNPVLLKDSIIRYWGQSAPQYL